MKVLNEGVGYSDVGPSCRMVNLVTREYPIQKSHVVNIWNLLLNSPSGYSQVFNLLSRCSANL